MNIALWLTISRLFLLPLAVLPVLLGWSSGWLISASVTALAGLTDIFDGYLARRKRQVTSLGACLDLITDKVFVGTMLVLLAGYGIIPVWMPEIVVVREVAIAALRFVRFRSHPPAPDTWGKAKTAVSIIAIVGVLLLQDLKTGGLLAAADARIHLYSILSVMPLVMWAAVALTVLSGANYFLRYTGILKRKSRHISVNTRYL